MMKFVRTTDFQILNVGFALDEGMSNAGDEFILFFGERSIWRKFPSGFPSCIIYFFSCQKYK